jgi:gliding motility-associated-like protein
LYKGYRQSVIINPTPPIAGFVVPAAGCSPLQIQFQNTSLYATNYLWDFGDGGISTKKDPFYTFFGEGTYAVTLNVTGPGGSSTFKADVTVFATPNTFFSLAPDSVYVNDKPVKFFNYTSDANNYLWNFGDVDEETGTVSSENTSGEFEPIHVYESIGFKDVLLITWNDNCSDTLLKENAVYVSPAGGLRFPNVFRPNPNGPSGGFYDPDNPQTKNTVFFPGLLDQVLEYNLYIYNRWGELIFESSDVNVGWDGYIKGRLARQGVYIWKVKGRYTNGKNFVETGDVTLLH